MIEIIIMAILFIMNIVQYIVLKRVVSNSTEEINKEIDFNNYLESFLEELLQPLNAIKNSTILSEDPLIKDLYNKVTTIQKKIIEFKNKEEENNEQ